MEDSSRSGLKDRPSAFIRTLVALPISSAQSSHISSQSPDTTTSHPAPIAESGQRNTEAKPAGPGGMSSGARIGIIVCIVIVVVLSIIAIGFCALDGRRRIQKWKEKRRANRDAESNMLETEMRNGRSSRRQRDRNSQGLWDGLREERDATLTLPARDATRRDPVLETYERRLRSVGMWGDDRRGDRSGSAREENVQRQDAETESASPPAHVRRERASIVSSVGSLGMPVVGPPIVAGNILDR